MQVLSGRYGPYVKHGDVNATLPRAKEPAALTMDEAVQLIAERAAKGPSKSKRRGAKPKARRSRPRPTSRPRPPPKTASQAEGGRRRQAEAQDSRQVGQAEGQGERGGRIGFPTRCPASRNRSAAAPESCPPRTTSSTFLQTAGSKAGKREIARHFGVKGDDRIALKSLLTEMADEGLLAGNRKGFKERGKLPPVCRARDRRPRRRTAS